MFGYEGVAHVGGDDGASERPLPLAGCASLRAACGRACVGSLRKREGAFGSAVITAEVRYFLVTKHYRRNWDNIYDPAWRRIN